MNDSQLDIVLEYLNEDIPIEEAGILYNIMSDNKDIKESIGAHRGVLIQLGSKYKKAAKEKDIKALEKIYKKIDKELDIYEKEIESIKVDSKDTTIAAGKLLVSYGFIIWSLKKPPVALISIGLYGMKINSTVKKIKGTIQDAMATIKQIKDNGVTADSINLYKNNARAEISRIRAYYKEEHKRNLERLKSSDK